MNYPEVIVNMDRHLAEMYKFRDQESAELEEKQRRVLITQQKIARLETARESLLQYLDYVNPGELQG